jgi:hypothetical protein
LKINVYKTILLPVVLYGFETWRKEGYGYLKTGSLWEYLGSKEIEPGVEKASQ